MAKNVTGSPKGPIYTYDDPSGGDDQYFLPPSVPKVVDPKAPKDEYAGADPYVCGHMIQPLVESRPSQSRSYLPTDVGSQFDFDKGEDQLAGHARVAKANDIGIRSTKNDPGSI